MYEFIRYVVLPLIGIMAVGYVLGRLTTRFIHRRREGK